MELLRGVRGASVAMHDVERLAEAAAKALTRGAGSAAQWGPVRLGFEEWFRRHWSLGDYSGELDQLRRQPPSAQAATYWRLTLFDVLVHASSPEAAADELTSLVDKLTSTAVAGPRETPSPPLVHQDHFDFRTSTFNAPVIGVQHNRYDIDPLHDPAGWSTVEATDPIGLGVRRTRRLDKDPELPSYVKRDVDERLCALVSGGGFVVVTGESLSGKSRTAWAAVLEALPPRTRVYSPSPGADLRALPVALRERKGSYVLWLDELKGHLDEHDLDSFLLGQLAELRVPVVGTMSDEAYDKRRFGGGPVARVLARAKHVELTCRWSPEELKRLEQEVDPQLLDAREWRGERGVTEYLAVGSELWDEWLRARRATAHPRGHLLVRVAVDLARLGVVGGVAPDVLEELSACYEQLEGLDPDSESWADALGWATGLRDGVTGMLVEDGPQGELRAFGSLVADAGRSSHTRTVPYEVWEAVRTLALDEGAESTLYARFAAAAYLYFSPRAEAWDPEAMFRLGRYGHSPGTVDREDYFREAASRGHDRAAAALAELLMARGDTAEARPYLEQAAKAGDSEASSLLGTLHREQAETWLRTAAEAGNGRAAHELGDMLVGTGREDEALRWYRKAAAAGCREVAASLGALLSMWRDPEAHIWLSYASAWGDARAAGELALHLSWESESDETEAVPFYEQAARGGDANAAHNLGLWMVEQRRYDEAMELYRQALDGGVTHAERSIAQLLELQGKPTEAQDWYRRADIANPVGLPAALPPPPESPLTPAPDTVTE